MVGKETVLRVWGVWEMGRWGVWEMGSVGDGE